MAMISQHGSKNIFEKKEAVSSFSVMVYSSPSRLFFFAMIESLELAFSFSRLDPCVGERKHRPLARAAVTGF